MKRGIIVSCVAIVTLGALEAIALFNGIDGAMFSSVSLLIGGIAGYELHKVKSEK